MSSSNEPERKHLPAILFLLSAAWTGFNVHVVLEKSGLAGLGPMELFESLELNMLGDYWAGVLAGPAFLLAAVGLWLQGIELQEQRKELSRTADQLEKANESNGRLLMIEEKRLKALELEADLRFEPILSGVGPARKDHQRTNIAGRSKNYPFWTVTVGQLGGGPIRLLEAHGLADARQLANAAQPTVCNTRAEGTHAPFHEGKTIKLQLFQGAASNVVRLRCLRADNVQSFWRVDCDLTSGQFEVSVDASGSSYWEGHDGSA